MRFGSWPRWVAVAGGLLGLLLGTQALGGPMGALSLLFILLLAQSMAASIAAVLVLIGTAIEYVARRPRAIASSRVPRVLAATIAASPFLFSSAAILVGVTSWDAVAMCAASASVIIFAAHPRLARALGPVALLCAGIATLEVPRELGSLTFSFKTSKSEITRSRGDSSGCTQFRDPGGGANPPRARVWKLASHLGGNIGRLVDPADQHSPEDLEQADVVVVSYEGDVDVGWAACLMPLYKSVSFDARIRYTYAVEPAGGGAPASCPSGTGTLVMHVDATMSGIASCRELRLELATRIREQLAGGTQELAQRVQ